MTKYRNKYELTWPFMNAVHTWSAIGSKGAVHLHINDRGVEHEQEYGKRYSGGFECHYRCPPDYMADDAPSHDHCHLLQAPCWHDGTSLWATEHWIPFWLASPNDHERMLLAINREMDERFASIGFRSLVASVVDSTDED